MVEPTPDPLIARSTDPETSTAGVKKTWPLKHMVFMCCVELGHGFTDTDLVKQIKHNYFVTKDRGVVARTRLTLERENKIRRLPTGDDDHEISFALTMNGGMIVKGSRI